MIQTVHILAFVLAGVGCLLGLRRARRLSHRETRYGLYGLFVTSGLWAVGEVVLFFDTSLIVARVSYQLALVAGIATVGAWLYFCSAYTDQPYHRAPVYRRGALAVFLGISALKLTNAVHGQYFTLERVTTPFPHVTVELLGLHWAITLLAYSLTAVGFYMLLQLFVESDVQTTGIAALVALTAVPVGLNVLSRVGVSGLVATNYEPLGVAAFAVGTLYLAEDTFEEVRWTSHRQILDHIDEAVIVTDGSGSIREYNAAARELFPGVEENVPLAGAVPALSSNGDGTATPDWTDEDALFAVEQDGETRYYLAKETRLTIGPNRAGQAYLVSDVTDVERQRRELQRQAEQLDGFAAAVAHELRNTLTIADANLTLVREALDSGEIDEATGMIDQISDATDRMTEVVCDLTTLAQLSQHVTDPQSLDFDMVARQAYATADTGDVTLSVDGEGRIEADEERFVELIRNAARLAAETDASELCVTLANGEFRLRIDGESLAEGDAEALFTYGTAVPHAEAGMLGPNLQTLARAHGWDISAVGADPEGVQIIVGDVTVDRLERSGST